MVNYKTFIEQGMKKIELENYMLKQLDKAGFTGLNIVKTPLVTRIVLNVTKPGLAIGKGGQNIKLLTKEIEERFGLHNPQIEIQEIPQPNLNAAAVVQRVSGLLEKGYSWRSVAFRTISDVQKAGAQGIELVLSGKLAGKGGRKRKQRIAVGYMKKVGFQRHLVDFAKASAYPKAGAIGIKLRIIRPDVIFPDKIDFREILRKTREAMQLQAVEAVQPEGEIKEEARESEEEKPEGKRKNKKEEESKTEKLEIMEKEK